MKIKIFQNNQCPMLINSPVWVCTHTHIHTLYTHTIIYAIYGERMRWEGNVINDIIKNTVYSTILITNLILYNLN